MGVNFVIPPKFDEKKICIGEMCKICKGEECCARCGCCYSPEDFHVFTYPYSREDRVKYLKAFLKRGYTSIELKWMLDRQDAAFYTMHYYSDIRKMKVVKEKLLRGDGILYLRTRNIGKGIVDVVHPDAIRDTGCRLQGPDGCKLTYRKRPKGGRMVVPKIHILDNCTCLYSEFQAAMDWFQYQDILFEVYEYFYKLEISD